MAIFSQKEPGLSDLILTYMGQLQEGSWKRGWKSRCLEHNGHRGMR